MRDIDREIGLHRDSDEHRAEEARRIGEELLYVDELEEEIGVLHSSEQGDAERIRRLEQEVEARRDQIRAIASRQPIDYGEIGRVMLDGPA